MIITGHHQHAAIGGTAIDVAMFDGVARPVDAGTLAVPQAEDPVDGGAGLALGLLRAGHDGGRHILVDRWQKVDIAIIQMAVGPPQLDIEGGQRRSAIAGYQPAGPEARGGIAARLVQHHADQRLRAVQEHPAGVLRVAGVKRGRRLCSAPAIRRRRGREGCRVVWGHAKSPRTAPDRGAVSPWYHCAAIKVVRQGGARRGRPVQKVAAGP